MSGVPLSTAIEATSLDPAALVRRIERLERIILLMMFRFRGPWGLSLMRDPGTMVDLVNELESFVVAADSLKKPSK